MDDDAQRHPTYIKLGLEFMMLASVFEKAEVAERMESARRHDPATLVELQNAIFTPVRPSTRPRGNKRRGRYENKVDAQGQPLKGMKKYKLDHTASMYWTDYLSLKDAAYYEEHPDDTVVAEGAEGMVEGAPPWEAKVGAKGALVKSTPRFCTMYSSSSNPMRAIHCSVTVRAPFGAGVGRGCRAMTTLPGVRGS